MTETAASLPFSVASCDILDLEQMRQKIVEEMNRKKVLEKHPYKIWQGTDGRFCTYIPMPEGKRKFIKRKNRQDVENEVIDSLGRGPTIREMFNEWNSDRLNRNAIRHSTYDQNVRVFDRFCKDFGNRYTVGLTATELARFLEAIPSEDITSKAFSNLKTILRGSLKRAKREGYIDFEVSATLDDLDIAPGMFKKRTPRPGGEALTDSEAIAIQEYLKQHLDIQNLGILLLFTTGMRVGELVALKHSDITEKRNGFVVRVSKTEVIYKGPEGKTLYEVSDRPKTAAGIRFIPVINEWAWLFELLKRQNPFGEYIFTRNGNRLTTNSIKRRLRRVCNKCGVTDKSPHMIRKWYATILLNSGMDSQTICSIMGHTSIVTTEAHYHKDIKTVDEKLDILKNISALCSTPA